VRTVHLQLAEQTILGLLRLGHSMGCKQSSMTGTLRKTLIDLVTALESTDQTDTSGDLAKFLSDEYGQMTFEEVALDGVSETVRDVIAQHAERLRHAQVTQGALDVQESNFGILPVEAEPSYTVTKTLSFDNIKRMSPLDRFVKQSEGDLLLRKALEVVYGNLPMSDWGGDVAERLIGKLYNTLLKTNADAHDEDEP